MSTASLFNCDGEKTVNGHILQHGIEQLEKALAEGLDSNHFFNEKNRILFKTFIKLATEGAPIDELTVKRSLQESGQLEKIGIPYLAGMTDGIPLKTDVAFYAREIVQQSRERTIVSAAANVNAASALGNGDLHSSIEDLKQAVIQYESKPKTKHQFSQIAEDRYLLSLPEIVTEIEVDRLRREHSELIGELSVRSNLPGVSSFDGSLSIADFNLSSARARTERSTLLSKRAQVDKLDWSGYLEEFCQRVLAAERTGQPGIDLRTVEKPKAEDNINIDGIRLYRNLPSIIFGDGGSAKSYLALYLLGKLAQHGHKVALFDWELDPENHRDRLERIFGQDMPEIMYARCEKALVYEADRLRRIVRDGKIDYAVYDSVAFACDGPPEAAEAAGRYFRAVRQIGVGSLHVAHMTKSDGGDQKPFGSVFWHNGGRSIYFIKLADSSPDGKTISIGLYDRKHNLSGQAQPLGYLIRFTQDQTHFSVSNPADTPDLAEKMSLRQRMAHLLRHGEMALDAISDTLEAKPDTVRRTVGRYRQQFTIIEGGKVALLQRLT
jgi:hypothetical protein